VDLIMNYAIRITLFAALSLQLVQSPTINNGGVVNAVS